ncbi:hypothetical protein Hanom_Chr10g00918611 [Helianthus anomalus]
MLKFKLRNLSWDNWDKSGTTLVKKFIQRSKFCKLVQFDNWVLIVPDNIFAPSYILSSDFITQSESKARVPESCCYGRLISLTFVKVTYNPSEVAQGFEFEKKLALVGLRRRVKYKEKKGKKKDGQADMTREK